MGVASSGTIPQGGKWSGRAVPVTGRVAFVAVRASGREATQQFANLPQIISLRAGPVRTPVF